ncbi:hypothetical protein GQ61_06150 [Candidatus Nucleicultrix amoebiphila FS5]|uniref:Uncharacterized protein n=1 Tax=Candidatus Nucleicultrix amoebiphila FS5 TaxID=1414854 RepID=A0A1W6N4Z5_9PROT|nr:hypothetical protein GQ61_06150 [Candidatus Nucleicultrix amoebiphila FS5]
MWQKIKEQRLSSLLHPGSFLIFQFPNLRAWHTAPGVFLLSYERKERVSSFLKLFFSHLLPDLSPLLQSWILL